MMWLKTVLVWFFVLGLVKSSPQNDDYKRELLEVLKSYNAEADRQSSNNGQFRRQFNAPQQNPSTKQDNVEFIIVNENPDTFLGKPNQKSSWDLINYNGFNNNGASLNPQNQVTTIQYPSRPNFATNSGNNGHFMSQTSPYQFNYQYSQSGPQSSFNSGSPQWQTFSPNGNRNPPSQMFNYMPSQNGHPGQGHGPPHQGPPHRGPPHRGPPFQGQNPHGPPHYNPSQQTQINLEPLSQLLKPLIDGIVNQSNNANKKEMTSTENGLPDKALHEVFNNQKGPNPNNIPTTIKEDIATPIKDNRNGVPLSTNVHSDKFVTTKPHQHFFQAVAVTPEE